MTLTITFCRATVKTLTRELHAAFRRNDGRRSKRISTLLLLADQVAPTTIAARLGLGRSTVYAWLRAFLVDGWASLRPRTSPGRPAKLTATQKQRLRDLVTAGPEAAGYPTGCWSSALLQDLIHREFGQVYSVHYLSELLRNL
ncbi:MAG TPA: helix-turn-helix domain-containing protein, partial [Herpetosiphonaceae bacterium]|nr:helix-turn-helix domain-containing protein [Herpetosiphonaceae bacterium]